MNTEFKPGDLVEYSEYDYPGEYILLLIINPIIERYRYNVILIQNKFVKSANRIYKDGQITHWTFNPDTEWNSFHKVK